MIQPRFQILVVSPADHLGGAEGVAYSLFDGYRQRGHESRLVVGLKTTTDPDILCLPNDAHRPAWARFWIKTADQSAHVIRDPSGRWRMVIARLGQPRRLFELARGREDFDYPATRHLLDLPPRRPEVVHCHNLHGQYFDLRALPWLSHQVPVVITMHDAWLLSGHSAHLLDPGAWEKMGVPRPRLRLPAVLRRAGTDYNLQRKQAIYAASRLFVATPSKWLMDNVNSSILAPGIVQARVIPNGVDLSTFRPTDQLTARAALDIPPDAKVLLFAARDPRRNKSKNFAVMSAAVARVAERLPAKRILFLVLGEDAPPGQAGRAEVRFIAFQTEPRNVARCHHAADLYVHAANAEVWGRTITEALACGTPVVATAVGGIPEQVTENTGRLVPPNDPEALARAIANLLTDDTLRHRLADNAAREARARFDLQRQITAYLDWYQEILSAPR